MFLVFLFQYACKVEEQPIQSLFGPDSTLIYGGSQKPEFRQALIQLNADKTGQYALWMGEHGWGWREAMKFTWKVANDTLYIHDDRDQPDVKSYPIGVIKKDKIIPFQNSLFAVRERYILLVDKKEAAAEILKRGL